MATMSEQSEQKVVFGLDIGTRSVVGTVGYMQDNTFNVMAQTVRKHETRAMLDGQIHDIGKVGSTIKEVKEALEEKTQIHLTDVCIAAAGRVLRTVKTNFEEEYTDNREMTQEEIYNLESKAVEKAYQEFLQQNQSDMKFYLVGYSVMHYYLDDYQIANLEGHNAGRVALDLIATFLPDDCVDGLYKACERADLKVANMTLEPIAAMMVAIPPQFRMLNLALVDVGAGTSDICITDDGTITSYGMLPIAGDSITEIIAQHCLVDFNTADQIKIDASHMEQVKYIDIMGLEKTISSKEIAKMIKPLVEKMSKMVTQQIKQLNGNKPVSAVFVVGGGGCVPGYTKALAKEMKIPEERVALRGEEVMKNIKFLEENSEVERDSLMVTPLGICVSFYEQSNNFVFVSFNGQQTKIYDNGKLAIVDAAMQADFPNEDLFPKRGEELRFSVNGQERMVRGEPGESAVITLNGSPADIHTKIHANDIIEVQSSTTGKPGRSELADITEFKGTFNITVDGKSIDVPRTAEVNGEPQTGYYNIKTGDEIKILDYETAEQIARLLDIELTEDTVITVNNEVAGMDTPVYENFKVEFKSGKDAVLEYYQNFPDADMVAIEQENEESSYDADAELNVEENEDGSYSISGNEDRVKPEPAPAPSRRVITRDLHVLVNNEPITLHGKSDYIFVDIFDEIDFDLSKPNGRSIVTTLNGGTPDYMQAIHEGDKIEVYWK
ncbi:cell division protein FtsA [Butyrivibrio sp. AE3006]|uniref:cell division protein FtsA n=1 Tax=Butyrivibrio sp. AE3006 TaxID=1280673 RepID=UPI0003F870C8|nr:cell division FtsA domain-containing protein [Butyrivibrio sp. AE3006]